MSVMVELTNTCNLKCKLCPSGNDALKRKVGFMEEDLFRKIVDDLDDTYVRDFIPAMWGESLLHPKFVELMKYARKKTWRISLSTNGNKKGDDTFFKGLVDSGIDEIVCAVDGHTQESYTNYRRNGNLQVVQEFLRKTRTARDAAKVKSPLLIAQIHLFSSNEDHLDDIKANVSDYVDKIQTKKTRTFYTDKEKISDIGDVREELKPKKEIFQFEGGRPSCPSMMHSISINWEGDLLACCKDPCNVLRFGNVKNQSIKEILNSDNYIKAKKRLFLGDFWEDICRDCYKL